MWFNSLSKQSSQVSLTLIDLLINIPASSPSAPHTPAIVSFSISQWGPPPSHKAQVFIWHIVTNPIVVAQSLCFGNACDTCIFGPVTLCQINFAQIPFAHSMPANFAHQISLNSLVQFSNLCHLYSNNFL